jgi:hypothetical protein
VVGAGGRRTGWASLTARRRAVRCCAALWMHAEQRCTCHQDLLGGRGPALRVCVMCSGGCHLARGASLARALPSRTPFAALHGAARAAARPTSTHWKYCLTSEMREKSEPSSQACKAAPSRPGHLASPPPSSQPAASSQQPTSAPGGSKRQGGGGGGLRARPTPTWTALLANMRLLNHSAEGPSSCCRGSSGPTGLPARWLPAIHAWPGSTSQPQGPCCCPCPTPGCGACRGGCWSRSHAEAGALQGWARTERAWLAPWPTPAASDANQCSGCHGRHIHHHATCC